MNHYTSFLDNVIVKMPAKERQQLQLPAELPTAGGVYTGKMTLRQYMDALKQIGMGQ